MLECVLVYDISNIYWYFPTIPYPTHLFLPYPTISYPPLPKKVENCHWNWAAKPPPNYKCQLISSSSRQLNFNQLSHIPPSNLSCQAKVQLRYSALKWQISPWTQCGTTITIKQTRQSSRAQGKRGSKNYQRGVQNLPKIVKEGWKTYQLTKEGCKFI